MFSSYTKKLNIMAEIILTNVLNTNISIDELFNWLTTDNPEETMGSDIVQNGPIRAAFVSYFLDYLRAQCKGILPEMKDTPGKQEEPADKTDYIESPKKNISKGKIYPSRNPRESPRHFIHNDYKSRHGGQPTFQPTSPVLTVHAHTAPLPGCSAAYNGPGNFPPLPLQNVNSGVPSKAICEALPLMAPQQDHCGNSSILENPSAENRNDGNRSEYVRQAGTTTTTYHDNSCNEKYPIGASSPYNSPINRVQIEMGNLNISSPDTLFDNNICNTSLQTNSTTSFENSMHNISSNVNLSSIAFSPVSPLYSNNTSILCPRRVNISHNEIYNSHDGSTGSINISGASTPNSFAGSGQKNSTSGSKRNVCLGDFIKSDGKDSKRTSKNHAKVIFRRQEHVRKEKLDVTTLNKEEITSPGTMAETRLKRRINPTRLNVSGDKETLGKEVFGVICRPTAANPKFVEAPSTDNCEEELSFKVERRLLKLERQRQPKSETTIEAAKSETVGSGNTKSETTIAPRLDLVDNVEKLNTLAGIYSGILDRNLMPNPMTELYFMVTLLTTQYRTLKDTKNVTKNAMVKVNKSSSFQMLEALKNDLGCAELMDDVLTAKNDQDSLNQEGQLNKSLNAGMRESLNADQSEELTDNSIDTGRKRRDQYLNTPHNCVYFATMVILKQHHLLTILDRATLKLLCENHQVVAFQPQLQKHLNDIYRVKCLRTNRVKPIGARNLQSNVCFQVYTDNCEAFPSVFTFSLFRKQRDAFYDLLKDWEDNHLRTTWSFQNALKNKINAPLTVCTDAVNYCHFAKLFISQLLVSSVRNGQSEDPMNDESLSFLKSLKHFNAEKLIQLKGRLITPLISTGPVPVPIFPGVQEFYQKFILHISNWKFLAVLETTLVHEILELNEVHFHPSEIEETETTLDESTKQNFITTVCSLRLLAKFAAFTVSLPFRSVANSPVWLQSQIQLRGRVLPLLDLKSCLLDALTHRRLSLTVPWLVQYMAMLDTVTLSLPYYVSIGELLYSIYRKSNYHRQLGCDDFSIPLQTAILMSFTIGWLFELPNFPRDLYTHWQTNYVEKKREIPGSSDPRFEDRKVIPMNAESSIELVKYRSTAIDELEIIDDRVFYECCPFLAEFKILLISGNATLSNSTANRHITPVSSQLSQSNSVFDAKPKNLQMQLEESFLHGQPSSIRKTIDFVYERIASNCVKYICNVIIPSSKQRNMKEFIKSKNGKIDLLIQKEEDDEDNSPTSPSGLTNVQSKIQANVATCQMEVLATTIKEDVKNECRLKIAAMCKTKTINSIEPLLADDAFPSVKETCTAIAMRMAIERIQQWIDTHIVESLFLKNMPIELTRLSAQCERDCLKTNRDSRHNPEVPCPTDVIGMMRNSMWELLEKKGRWAELSVEYVTKTLTSLQQTLMERSDLVDAPERTLYKMSVEYCLLLITHRPDLFTPEIQQHFQNLWKMSSEDLFTTVISPRNIRMLTSTSDPSVMTIFGCLLTTLLREDQLKIEALSEQCVTLFRQEWPDVILKQLSQCLKNVVAGHKYSGSDAQSLKYLLGWIAATLEEMETCDYD